MLRDFSPANRQAVQQKNRCGINFITSNHAAIWCGRQGRFKAALSNARTFFDLITRHQFPDRTAAARRFTNFCGMGKLCHQSSELHCLVEL